jgi:hypothetical protein
LHWAPKKEAFGRNGGIRKQWRRIEKPT